MDSKGEGTEIFLPKICFFIIDNFEEVNVLWNLNWTCLLSEPPHPHHIDPPTPHHIDPPTPHYIVSPTHTTSIHPHRIDAATHITLIHPYTPHWSTLGEMQIK